MTYGWNDCAGDGACIKWFNNNVVIGYGASFSISLSANNDLCERLTDILFKKKKTKKNDTSRESQLFCQN